MPNREENIAAGLKAAQEHVCHNNTIFILASTWKAVPVKDLEANLPARVVEEGGGFPKTVEGHFRALVDGEWQNVALESEMDSLLFCWGEVMDANQKTRKVVRLIARTVEGAFVSCSIGVGPRGFIPNQIWDTKTDTLPVNFVSLLAMATYNTVTENAGPASTGGSKEVRLVAGGGF